MEVVLSKHYCEVNFGNVPACCHYCFQEAFDDATWPSGENDRLDKWGLTFATTENLVLPGPLLIPWLSNA
jgi:hypothetical protein